VNHAHAKREIFAFASLIGLTLLAALVLLLTGPAPSGPTLASASVAADAGAPVTPKPAVAPAAQAKPVQALPKANKPLGEVTNVNGEPLDVTADCEDSLALAAKRGLTLPDGWKIYCTGPGLDWDGNTHWGVTCPYASCPEGAGPYVSISNPTYYVVAHELCHANFGNDELMADACAAKHGASLETSPYQ
jgi:hypothetical protein